ncbi:MAG: outer membrane protein assembly factor BamD, partial [Gemmatimonadota bacterium]
MVAWRRLVWVLALVAGAPACASVPVSEVLAADEEYAAGRTAFEEGRWSLAAEHLNRFVLNYAGDPRVAEARFLLGQANFELEEYPSAALDFERFQTDFPADSLADDALFLAGRSYEEQSLRPQLDQADTRRAISSYESLVDQYPASPLVEDVESRAAILRERLAEKEYMNARYYFRQELWEATE